MATVDEQIRSLDPQALDEVNKYIDEMKATAQGDYDFVVKFLKKQFEVALGNNDQDRANFITKVANQLEQRVGRIPYDYDLKTGREKEDIANYLKRLDLQDTDIQARKKELTEQTKFATEQETQQRQEEFNARGLSQSGLELKKKQEQERARALTLAPQQRALALEEALAGETRREAVLQSGRRLEDLTTSARRGAQDTQLGYEQGTEGAQRSLAARLAEISRIGAAEKRNVLGQLYSEEQLSRLNQQNQFMG